MKEPSDTEILDWIDKKGINVSLDEDGLSLYFAGEWIDISNDGGGIRAAIKKAMALDSEQEQSHG